MAKSVKEFLDDLSKCREAYDTLAKSMKELNEHINKLKTGLQDTCTHEETKVEADYFPGSYYDRSYTEYTTKCTVCDKKLAEKTVTGHYG